MNGLQQAVSPQGLVSDLDRLIIELSNVRRRVAALVDAPHSAQTTHSVKGAEWFGLWADREDLRELSSREWLPQLRSRQWSGQ